MCDRSVTTLRHIQQSTFERAVCGDQQMWVRPRLTYLILNVVIFFSVNVPVQLYALLLRN